MIHTAGALEVLLVDDNPDDRALVRRALEKSYGDATIREVGTAAAFDESLGSDAMDVVITDYLLRWGDGMSVLHQVRGKWPNCAVIMFTDSGDEEIATRALRSGLDDYVVKSARHAERLPLVVQRALDRRNQQQRARVAEAQIQELFDRLPAGVYRVNENDRVLYANRTLARILGYDSAADVIGADIAGAIVDPEDRDRRRSSEGDVITSTLRLRRKDGEIIWVRDSGRIVRDVDGTPLYYEGVIQDVTSAQRAQIEARRQSSFVQLLQDVTATANEYDSLDDALAPALHVIRSALGWPLAHVYRQVDGVMEPTGVWDGDGSDRFSEFRNRTVTTSFARGEGLPGRALERGATAWMNGIRNDPDYIRIQPGDTTAFQTGIAMPVVLGGEVLAVLEFYHSDDLDRDPSLLTVLDQAGVQLGRVAERERAKEARLDLEATAREAQRLDAIGRLAGGVAHDFNNLLTVIRTQTDLLHSDLQDRPELLDEVAAIQLAADRAATLTSQLLAFSREQQLEPRVVRLNDVVEEVASLLERVLGEDIEVVKELERALAPIEVDPAQLEQILLNLAVNARHAMPEGGRLTLSTGAMSYEGEDHPELDPDEYVVLRVADTGHGMDRETRQRVFEPFFTTKARGEGTGLGLAMAHGVMKQSGGTIEVESEPGAGATFSLYFPATDKEPVPLADSGAMASSSDAPEALSSGRILVVEDEPSVRAMIQKALERSGFEVHSAESGEAALELVRGGTVPDLLLTDFVLPGIRGNELALRMRELVPELRVVLMSGYTEGGLDIEASGLHDVRFVAKPFTVRELAQAVMESLAAG